MLNKLLGNIYDVSFHTAHHLLGCQVYTLLVRHRDEFLPLFFSSCLYRYCTFALSHLVCYLSGGTLINDKHTSYLLIAKFEVAIPIYVYIFYVGDMTLWWCHGSLF